MKNGQETGSFDYEESRTVRIIRGVGSGIVSSFELVRDGIVAAAEELDGDCTRTRPGTPTLPHPASSELDNSNSTE